MPNSPAGGVLSRTAPPTIEELLARDPLSLREEDLEQNTKLLVQLSRAQRRVWEDETAAAAAKNKRLSGASVKKKQKTAERQTAAALLDFSV